MHMLKCVSKIFTGVLAVSCLSVAAVNVRMMMSTSSSVSFTTPDISFSNSIAQNNISIAQKIETKMSELNFEEKTVVAQKTIAKTVVPAKVATPVAQKFITLKEESINFNEPVKLTAVKYDYSLPQNLVALATEFKYVPAKAAVMVAEVEKVEEVKKAVKEDSVSTIMAAGSQATSVEEEPVFFEYSEMSAPKKQDKIVEAKVETKPAVKSEVVSLNKADYEKMADEFIAFDYSTKSEAAQPVNNIEAKAAPVTETKTVNASVPVLVEVSDLPAEKEVTTQKVAPVAKKVAKVSTQASKASAVVMSIQAKATNLKKNKEVNNFEVRFQDNLNEIYEDFGAGSVEMITHANTVMNRSMVLLKRGYAPTNTDLIVENNSKAVLPLIEEEVFNSLLDKVSTSAAHGALLIEFDDETESVRLDGAYATELLLDENLKTTKAETYRYKLFLGINAGNMLVTYRDFNGAETSKIVHIHERELTFDANLYEAAQDLKVSFFEEGLLSKELSPLIIKGDQVRVFATDKVSTKLNQNTHKLNFKKHLLGERKYLEVNHLEEPIFVGLRENTKVVLPSENFIGLVLSKFENRKLGNRCIVQLNLDAPVADFFVGSESAGSNLVTSTQILDQDGKFYDSVGPKSNKILILGENHAPADQSRDGKINIKIDYLDGSSRFVTSYCSPNTYLVEQL